MNNFSKILMSSSLVLGSVLFSIGCGGGDSFCCEKGEPPIPKIADSGTAASYAGGQYTLEDDMILKLNGLSDSVDTDNGTVTKCNWYIANEDGSNKKLVLEQQCENVEIDFSSYANNTKHLVCLEVIDNDGLSSKLNNGRVPEYNNGGEIRKKDGAIEYRKEYDCRKVVISKSEVPQVNLSFGIYNTKDNQLVSSSPVKEGCPYYIKPTLNVTSGTTCVWSIDGTNRGTDCAGITGLSHDDLNGHEICLTVNGDISTKKCQTFTAVEHSAPTAVMKILDNNNNDVTNANSLSKDVTHKLSCSGSKNDCPLTDEGIECKWHASSFAKVAGSCDVPEANRVYKFENCLAAHGVNDTSSPSVAVDLLPEMYTCDSNDYDCIEVNLTVTDTRFGKRISADTISKIYEAN